jgi:tetrahydrodipicolinate N-succinyltransferase
MMIANLELTRLVNPQNANVLFELARAYALADRKKDALEMLEQTARNGFADCVQINDKAVWKNLQGEQQFQKIIAQMNCQK